MSDINGAKISRRFLTLSPTLTESANGAEEAMTARANRGRRSRLIMIKHLILVIACFFGVCGCAAFCALRFLSEGEVRWSQLAIRRDPTIGQRKQPKIQGKDHEISAAVGDIICSYSGAPEVDMHSKIVYLFFFLQLLISP